MKVRTDGRGAALHLAEHSALVFFGWTGVKVGGCWLQDGASSHCVGWRTDLLSIPNSCSWVMLKSMFWVLGYFYTLSKNILFHEESWQISQGKPKFHENLLDGQYWWKSALYFARDILRQKKNKNNNNIKKNPNFQPNNFLFTYRSLVLSTDKLQESNATNIIKPILVIWQNSVRSCNGRCATWQVG